ncbi:MAG: hypothetical protein QXX49_07470 [Candidatus Caldarchaeum sp.]|uniref:Uncharacterized protein n=1 Tax=Caldiarchaeum subterraneum TaxID=311458 RepID=A0A7J3VUC9_CALS0
MRYVSIRDVRIHNGWQPIEVQKQLLKRVDDTHYQTAFKPLVDADWDGTLMDDVAVFLNGDRIEPEAIDPDQGIISIYPPPSEDARVESSYFWHPIGDAEVQLAVEAAEAEVEALTGTVFKPHPRVERVVVRRGRAFNLSEPVLQLLSVKIYDAAGNMLDDDAEAEVVDPQTGLVRLAVSAGEPQPPWYLTHPLEVEAVYQAGYSETPSTVKQAVLTLASYYVLARLQRSLSFAESYGGVVVAGVAWDDLESRLSYLREEVERVRKALPRRVGKA